MTLYFTVKYELYYNLIRGDVSAGFLTFLLSQHAITTITVKRCVCVCVKKFKNAIFQMIQPCLA